MNRIVYPYLERALQHYGIGNRVVMNYTNGKIKMKEHTVTSWSYPDEDSVMHTFSDALEYQSFHARFSPIVFTNVNTEPPKRRLHAMF